MKKFLLTSLSIMIFSGTCPLVSYANDQESPKPEEAKCPKAALGMNAWINLQEGHSVVIHKNHDIAIKFHVIPEDIKNFPLSAQPVTWRYLASSLPFKEDYDEDNKILTCTYRYQSSTTWMYYTIRLQANIH